MTQWWERSPPTNVAQVQIPASTPTICGLSLLLVLSFAPSGFSPGTPVFPSPHEEPLCGCAISKSSSLLLLLISGFGIKRILGKGKTEGKGGFQEMQLMKGERSLYSLYVKGPAATWTVEQISVQHILGWSSMLSWDIVYQPHSRGRGWGWGWMHPHKVSLSFFPSSRSFIPRADFESSLVMVSCYGYVGVIFHVKYKKLSLLAVAIWFPILGKIQDGDHCWWRHRSPAALPPIKYIYLILLRRSKVFH